MTGKLSVVTCKKKQEGYDTDGHYVKYILETDFYELLKFSAEEHGKISHFEKV